MTNALYIVAHPDDSLLFQSPTLLTHIYQEKRVLTVHLSAGENGRRERYWRAREAGIKAAYASMAGVANEWSLSSVHLGDRPLEIATLGARPDITMLFFRLPDGGFPEGGGTSRYGFESLTQLWHETSPSIRAVDGSGSYTKPELISTLAALMASFEPDFIATHDYANTFGDGDHMDHYATALLVRAANASYSRPHQLVGFEGYPGVNRKPNVVGDLLRAKQDAFYAYGAYDSLACSSERTCRRTPYAQFLAREYVAIRDVTGNAAE